LVRSFVCQSYTRRFDLYSQWLRFFYQCQPPICECQGLVWSLHIFWYLLASTGFSLSPFHFLSKHVFLLIFLPPYRTPPGKKTQHNPQLFFHSWCRRRIGNHKVKALGVIRDVWSLTAATYSRSIVAQIKEKSEPKEDKIGKTDNHIGYQNRKTASICYENRKPDAKKQKIHKPWWTPKPKNRSVLAQKPKNWSKK